MKLTLSYYSSQGARSCNEDYATIAEKDGRLLIVVTDGLGGMSYGDVASREAATILLRELKTRPADAGALEEAIRIANDEIAAMQKPGSPMRTTAAVLWCGNGQVLAANTGDTRIYQFRNGRVHFRSLDHSVAQMAVSLGELEESGIRTCPDRNRLLSSLGGEEVPEISVTACDLQPGDRFLVCTDGFWEPVLEEDMLGTLFCTDTPQQWLDQMLQIIEQKDDPKQDNYTAVCLIASPRS